MHQYKPDQAYWKSKAELAVRKAGVDESQVLRVDLNCGDGSFLAHVVLLDGSKIKV